MLTTQITDPTKPVTGTAPRAPSPTAPPATGVSVEAPTPAATDAKGSTPTAVPQLGAPPAPPAAQLTSALGAQSAAKPPAPPEPPTGPANTNPISTQSSTLALGAQSAPPPPAPPPAASTGSAALPTGFTMGTGDQYGASYYNGQKVIGASATGPDGKSHWVLADGSLGPDWDQQTEDAIRQAAHAGYGAFADQQQRAAEDQNPNLKAYRDAARAWAQQAGVPVDSLGMPVNGIDDAPDSVKQAYQQFVGNPIAPPPSTAPTGPARYLQNGQEIGADGRPIQGGYNALSEYYRQTGTTPGAVNPAVESLIRQNPGLLAGLPADEGAAVQRTATGISTQGLPTELRNLMLPPVPGATNPPSTYTKDDGSAIMNAANRNLAPGAPSTTMVPGAGPANDAGGSIPSPSSLPTLPGASGSTGSTVGGVPGVSQINPTSDLRSSMITPTASGRLSGIQGMVDQAAQGVSGIDRAKLAQDMFDTFQKSGEPAYQAALRAATQRAAANGQLGSGGLNTTYGDLAHQRELELDAAKQNLTQQALSDSVNDALNKERTLQGLEGQVYGQEAGNRNELRGERGYQVGQEQNAYDRALQQFLTQNGLQNQNFEQGLQLLGLSSAGNPAGYLGNLSGQLGGMDPQTVALLAQLMARNGGLSGLPAGTSYGGFGGDYTVPPGQAVA